MEFLEVEEGAVRAAYEAHLAAPHDVEGVVAVLRAHPFVKETAVVTVELPAHVFTLSGFSLNVKAFMKWLNTPSGRPFKARAGGFSDDGLYTISRLLRTLLPRGYHRVAATNRATGAVAVTAFVGIRKFTGLGAGDEDEESNSTDDSSAFFFGSATMADATTLWRTLKSNGENAKFMVWRLDGTDYLLAGSKVRCLVGHASGTAVDGAGGRGSSGDGA